MEQAERERDEARAELNERDEAFRNRLLGVEEYVRACAERDEARALLRECREWVEHAADRAMPLGRSNYAVASKLLARLDALLGGAK